MSKASALSVATTVVLFATLLGGSLTARRISEALAVPLDQIDAQIAGWTMSDVQVLPPGTLSVLKPTAYLSRSYRKGTSQLDLFVAFYAQQRAGESMHSPKHCLPGSGWEIWQYGAASIPVNGKTILVNKYSIENLGQRMLMYYWYQSADRIIASEYRAKLLLASDTILTGRTAGSLVRIALPDAPGSSEAAMQFASKLIPEVQRCFGYHP